MELARNPAMLQELMRSQDRAMSNLEVNIWVHFVHIHLTVYICTNVIIPLWMYLYETIQLLGGNKW